MCEKPHVIEVFIENNQIRDILGFEGAERKIDQIILWDYDALKDKSKQLKYEVEL